jgi:hypothetical protein
VVISWSLPTDSSAPVVGVSTDPAGAPSGQAGFFNAHDLSSHGGKITVKVSASDPSGVASISCTDNGHAVAVAGQSGSDPRTGSFDLAKDGTHQISCQATDAATPPNSGAASGSHSTATVKIDKTAPSASTRGLPRFERQHPITVRWSGVDGGSGVKSFDVRQRQAGAGSRTFGSFHAFRSATARASGRFAGRDGNTACFSTRARDEAGNVSGYTSERCTATPLDDRALRHSRGWRLGGRRGYYAGTISRTTTSGAKLVSPLITGSQLALLVTTSPDAGAIRISWHGHTRILNLHGTHTQNRRLILTGYAGTGRLTIKTLSTGAVAIDGLAALKHA